MGQNLRLAFELKKAKLYPFWIEGDAGRGVHAPQGRSSSTTIDTSAPPFYRHTLNLMHSILTACRGDGVAQGDERVAGEASVLTNRPGAPASAGRRARSGNRKSVRRGTGISVERLAVRAVAERSGVSAASSVMISLPGATAMCCRMFRVSSRRRGDC